MVRPRLLPMKLPGPRHLPKQSCPFVQDHNTILLANHGVVCWSDTVTHAEWLIEVLDGYCKTYLIARQVGKPSAFIPDDKIKEILALKRRLGFPDARMELLPSWIPKPRLKALSWNSWSGESLRVLKSGRA